MKVEVIYCYPQLDSRTYYPLAHRFAQSWREHAPGYPHTLVIGCNGGAPLALALRPFAGIPHEIAVHNNYGWDIGLYQSQAYSRPRYLLVCLGAGTVITHASWLAQLVTAVLEHGPGVYGAFGVLYPNPHLRTTAFTFPSELLCAYPHPVTSDRRSRYAFEHGKQNFTRFVMDLGFPAVMVTRKGVFPWPQWNDATIPSHFEALLLDKQHL